MHSIFNSLLKQFLASKTKYLFLGFLSSSKWATTYKAIMRCNDAYFVKCFLLCQVKKCHAVKLNNFGPAMNLQLDHFKKQLKIIWDHFQNEKALIEHWHMQINTRSHYRVIMQAIPSWPQKYKELIVRLYTNLHLKYIRFEKLLLDDSKPNFETPTNFNGTKQAESGICILVESSQP